MQNNFNWKEQQQKREFIETIAFIISCLTLLIGIIVLPLLGFYIYFIVKIGGWRNETNEEICVGDNINNPKLWKENIRRSYIYLFFTFISFCIIAFSAATFWMQATEFLQKIFGN